MKKLLSVVVPCYNEQEALMQFKKELNINLNDLPIDYEVIFVDDGSSDDTLNIIKGFASEDRKIKYISFSRNFGKEAAMYAGLEKSKGDYVVIMDADLQDPPKLLKEMYDSIESNNYDCVATRRVNRKGEPAIRSWFARTFYKLINKESKFEIVDGARDYRMMTRKMVDSILKLKERNRFSKGLFGWAGFNTKWLEYENENRVAGETKWSFSKLVCYAIEGFVSVSVKPLYSIAIIGVGIVLLDIITSAILLICGVSFAQEVLVVGLIALLIGFLIICLGICSIYQAKMYIELKARPIYISKESNIDK